MQNAPKIAPVKQDEIKPQISDAIIKKIELEVAKWVKFVNLSGIITMDCTYGVRLDLLTFSE